MDVDGMETLIAALADDTTIIGELRTFVHLFLLIQKLAKDITWTFTEVSALLTPRQEQQKCYAVS